MKNSIIITLLAFAMSGCIQLDFFLFDGYEAESVEEDYHGLPLWNGDGMPVWIEDAEIEREIFLRVPTAEVIPVNSIDDEDDYIHGVFLHAPTSCPVETCPLIEDPPTILYQHGRSGHMWRYWWRAVALWNLGANLFIYTYRGYGISSGEATAARVLEDAETALTYILGRPETNLSNLIAYGYSLGGVPTSHLVGRSSNKDVFRACILEAPFDRPASLVNVSTGTDMPDGFFLDADVEFNGPKFIQGANLPILHMHGQRDSTLVIEQADNYYNVLKDRPGYTHYLGKTDKPDEAWIRGCGHRNIPVWTWEGTEHIADYWSYDENPNHCCVNPIEYAEPVNSSFIEGVGFTTGDDLYNASVDYRDLLSSWLLTN